MRERGSEFIVRERVREVVVRERGRERWRLFFFFKVLISIVFFIDWFCSIVIVFIRYKIILL